ncbi:MAG: TolC family protein, partial [Lachnospiraceae bacterium]|nr:TolC family protein [Lachnospiraceae bacterium]
MQLRKKLKLHSGRRLTALLLTAAILAGLFLPASFPVESEAALLGKTITMKACRKLAILNSTDYESAEDTVASKQAAYESAVKALKVKEKDMKTFRWSPLLSFKFPTSPDFAQASEFQYKPIGLTYDIRVAQHNLQDKTFAIAEKVNNLYVEIVVLQETIEFNERRAKALEEGLAKNRAKLKLGEANQSDVDKQEKNLETVNNKIAGDRRTLEADLQKLSKMINLDVTTGYRFEKPFVEATIERSSLAAITQYTLDRDEGYYEACVKSTTARAELQINSSLMRNKYGGDYNMIGGYVQTALNGGSINKKAFKAQYKSFVDKIDSYWKGKKRILFIKIPRLWFKGSMDGT